MSYFDDASLVMIPSGYKTSKVYSVKPTDGSGDLTFSRSNDTATRVNSAGLIEKVRTNLLTYSNTFSNAAWSQTYVQTPTANAIANPLTGAVDAWKLVEDGTNNFHYILQTPTFAAGEVSFSFYAKSAERTTCSAFLSQGGNVGASFNLSTGVATASGTGNTASMVSVGGGWYRCIVTNNGSATVANQVRIGVADGALSSYAGDGTSGIYIYAAQAEQGVATAYIATTSSAVSVGPVANVPRLDYLGSSCPRLLLEPQRTNLAQYSEQFNNAWWEKVGGSFTANALTSPDGYTDADTFTENTSTSTHYFYNASGFTGTAAAYTGSVFAKAGTRSRLIMGIYDGTAANYQMVQFDLSAGTILQEASAGIAKIENYGNGWYRCSVTRTLTASTCYLSFGPHTNTNLSNLTVFPSYLGASGTLHFYGGQFELGAYATSYIPTLGAAVTRGADAASKTGISSLIGQTEGTFFAEFTIPETQSASFFSISNGTSANRIIFGYYLGVLRYYTNSSTGSFSSAGVIDAAPVVGQTYKIAIAYKANDFKVYKNGSNTNTETTFTVPASLTALDNEGGGASQNIYAGVKQLLLFKTRLSNADLAALTA